MANQFTDVRVIECGRLHSEEAKVGNNENTSLWQNNLEDILLLEPEDTVSVYGAFISERGAGQGQSIEIKGVQLGEKKTFEYINLSYINNPSADWTIDNPQYNLPSRAGHIKAEYKQEEFDLRDDTLRFVINYYMTANANNMMHLPRRWMYNVTSSEPLVSRENWINIDTRGQNGFSLTYPERENITSDEKYYLKPHFYKLILNKELERLVKPKNDNSRYTLMIRNDTYFTEINAKGTGAGELPAQDVRDPENHTYQIYREMKAITIPAGFNSAEYIATEITRQMQDIITDKQLIQDNTGSDNFPIGVSKLIESETYKAFNTGSVHDNSKENFLKYFNLTGGTNSSADRAERAGWTNASGFEWLRQYQIVGCKYPEIYETGRLINRSNQEYNGIMGTYLTTKWSTLHPERPFVTDVTYNEARCNEWKAFFDAQELYPEIIDALNASGTGFKPGNTVDNTRWIHINRHNNYYQYLGASSAEHTVFNTQLGWGGYYNSRARPTNASYQFISQLLPIYFDPSTKDTFFENPDTDNGQYTYGALGNVGGKIAIFPSRHVKNGYYENPELYVQIAHDPAGVFEVKRKLGFDMHFNAQGMYYMLPLSGWTDRPNVMSSLAGELSDYNVPDVEQSIYNLSDPIGAGTPSFKTDTTYDLNPWKKLLYMGAIQPSFVWDGTNFGIKGLHTGLNKGNEWEAGNPIFPSVSKTEGEQDVVYKINPRESFNNYTPDRMPYTDAYTANASLPNLPEFTAPQLNVNLEQWKIYDSLSGIFIEDFGIPENLWTDSLWGLLGFSYEQFHQKGVNRQTIVDDSNANRLSTVTTNADIIEGDTKLLSTNWAGTAMYNGMITTPVNLFGVNASGKEERYILSLPQIENATESYTIVAENLPTRMIRGYYTIRSNILENAPFIGGKVNNTSMPILGIVDKMNGAGDFYTQQESSLTFTITKPLRLASITTAIMDPDGSYARTSDQSTVLIKVQKPVKATFNVVQEILSQLKPKDAQQFEQRL